MIDQDDEVVNVGEVKKQQSVAQDRKNPGSSLNQQKRKSQLESMPNQNVRHSQQIGNSKIGLGVNQLKQSSVKGTKGKQTPMQPLDDADEYAEDEFEDHANEDDSPAKNTGPIKSIKRSGPTGTMK